MERRKIDVCLRGRGCRDGNLAPASLAIRIKDRVGFDRHQTATGFNDTADIAGLDAFDCNGPLDCKRGIGASIKNDFAVCRLRAGRFNQAFDIDDATDRTQRGSHAQRHKAALSRDCS